jgi:hypothetical protein
MVLSDLKCLFSVSLAPPHIVCVDLCPPRQGHRTHCCEMRAAVQEIPLSPPVVEEGDLWLDVGGTGSCTLRTP